MTKFTMWLGGMKGIEDMRVCFAEMDADGNGSLSLDEFRQGLSRTCGMELEEVEVADLMQLLDTNGDGELQVSRLLIDSIIDSLDMVSMLQESVTIDPNPHNHTITDCCLALSALGP
jgi:Ca2+-binding EF-hand superfamily protein